MWSRWSFEVDDKHLVTTQTWELSAGNKVALLGTTQHSRSKLWTLAILPYSLLLNCSIAQWSNLGVQKDITSTGFELQKWFLHQNGVELQCQWQIWLMFVHSADKLAKMRTKFHFIQAKLIMSVWCFTVHCCLGNCFIVKEDFCNNFFGWNCFLTATNWPRNLLDDIYFAGRVARGYERSAMVVWNVSCLICVTL